MEREGPLTGAEKPAIATTPSPNDSRSTTVSASRRSRRVAESVAAAHTFRKPARSSANRISVWTGSPTTGDSPQSRTRRVP